MLATAGRLDPALFGPPVDLAAADCRRRTMYGLVDRQNLAGMLRSLRFCQPRRPHPTRHVTTVPQQALFLLNSPLVVEQAAALAERTATAATAEPAEPRELPTLRPSSASPHVPPGLGPAAQCRRNAIGQIVSSPRAARGPTLPRSCCSRMNSSSWIDPMHQHRIVETCTGRRPALPARIARADRHGTRLAGPGPIAGRVAPAGRGGRIGSQPGGRFGQSAGRPGPALSGQGQTRHSSLHERRAVPRRHVRSQAVAGQICRQGSAVPSFDRTQDRHGLPFAVCVSEIWPERDRSQRDLSAHGPLHRRHYGRPFDGGRYPESRALLPADELRRSPAAPSQHGLLADLWAGDRESKSARLRRPLPGRNADGRPAELAIGFFARRFSRDFDRSRRRPIRAN